MMTMTTTTMMKMVSPILVQLWRMTRMMMRMTLLSGSNIFSWVRIRIGRNSGSDLEKSGSGSMKKPPKTVSTSRQVLYFIFSTLHTVLFGQVTPKPNQKNSLDGSGYGFLKSGYGSAKKPGSIRIRNTDCYECCESGMIYSGYDFLEFRIPGPSTELVKNKILISLLFHSCRILIRNNNSGSGKRFRIRPDPDSQHWFLTDTGNFYDKQQCWGSELFQSDPYPDACNILLA